MRRCPLARHGLGSDLLAACPGFDSLRVAVEHGPGVGLNGLTCSHIASGSTGRGFAATCCHPEAERIVPAAREVARGIPSARPQDVAIALLGRREPTLPEPASASTRPEWRLTAYLSEHRGA
jgi:hypothetical protein